MSGTINIEYCITTCVCTSSSTNANKYKRLALKGRYNICNNKIITLTLRFGNTKGFGHNGIIFSENLVKISSH